MQIKHTVVEREKKSFIIETQATIKLDTTQNFSIIFQYGKAHKRHDKIVQSKDVLLKIPEFS